MIAAYIAIVAVMGLLLIPAILNHKAGMNIFDLKAMGYSLKEGLSSTVKYCGWKMSKSRIPASSALPSAAGFSMI